MVNGTPIALEGQEGEAIKECLLRGAIPNQDLLNHLLYKVSTGNPWVNLRFVSVYCVPKFFNPGIY